MKYGIEKKNFAHFYIQITRKQRIFFFDLDNLAVIFIFIIKLFKSFEYSIVIFLTWIDV